MPKMVTKKSHKYRAVTYNIGDTYDALDNDVATLRRTGWADFDKQKPKLVEKKVDANTYKTKHLEAE